MPASPTHLSPFDLALVVLYLVGITVFGLRFSRRSKSTQAASLKTYFLADNVIPWWAIALSIVSAETSTLTIVSIPGVAYAGNLGFLQVVLGYLVGRVVVAYLFLPRYFRGEMLTAYQLIDRRFGTALHKLTAGLFLLTRAAAEGVRVFAISIVVSIAIGTGDTLSIAIISALTLLYTFEGGMAAVIWTDVVQMGLYLAGTLVALLTLGAHVPGGWGHIVQVAQPLGKFHLFDFAFSLTRAYTFWAGLVGGTFLTMASHGTDQLMVQRMLAARNLRESRIALLSSGVVIFVQFALFLLIGVGLYVFYAAHPVAFASNDRIFPTFIVHELPHGVAGLLVAAILAAAMSNLSAALNSLASTTVVDFYVPFRGRHDARNGALVSRIATVFWAIVLFAIAVYSIHAGGKGHVVETGLSIASVAYGCLLGVFLLGTLTRYATQPGAIAGMIAGLATNLALWQLPNTADSGLTLGTHFVPWSALHVAFTWYVFIGSVVTFAVGSAFSLLLPKPRRGLVLLLALVAGASTTGASHAQDFTPLDTLIQTAIAERKLPGAVLVVGHNGHVVYRRAYGNRALEPTPEAMTEDTLFDMASLSKVLSTTTAVLQLYQAHTLDLDTPVAHYLPSFAANGKDKITVRQLLTHYSGLPEDLDLKDPWGLAAPDKAEGIRRALATTPYGPPGITFRYSDINFITLGALVEALSGQSLDSYASAHIFTPLGMSSTAYHPFAATCGPATRSGAAILPGATFEPVVEPPTVAPPGQKIHHNHILFGSIQTEPPTCPPGTWSPNRLDPGTAPTAHDDEATATANPNFDHILRGTVHDPTTRRMGGVAGHAGVFSNADDTTRFTQALLDKLLRNSGPFPLSQATLRLAVSPQAPATAITTATVFRQDGTPTTGIAQRGLGWDLNSAFSRPRGAIFPIATQAHAGSFGHTGFTGTSVWIDPVSDTYVILLANAIHPHVGANISPLRGQVATAAAQALGLSAASSALLSSHSKAEGSAVSSPTHPALLPAAYHPPQQTQTGIDVLEDTDFQALRALANKHGGQLRLGLLTNVAATDAHGRTTLDILRHAPSPIELKTVFTPEHGLHVDQDSEHLHAEAATISLYGPRPSDKRPRQSDLKPLDAVLIDLQDAGVRFWTYETLLGYFLEATAQAHIDLIVLDRPNPAGGLAVQGPVSDPGLESYTDFMPLPVRHGLTFAELARYFNANATEIQLQPELLNAEPIHIGPESPARDRPPATLPGLHASLITIPMRDWQRGQLYADTGLPWTPPSPNLKTLAATLLYPGVGLTEQTDVSVGRGTPTPFENLGAPWIDSKALALSLTQRHIPGIRVTPTTLTIAEDTNRYPFHGQTVPGVHFEVTNPAAFDSPEFGIELLGALHTLYPRDFHLDRAHTLVANAATMQALTAGTDPRTIAATWTADLATFRQARAAALLYPER